MHQLLDTHGIQNMAKEGNEIHLQLRKRLSYPTTQPYIPNACIEVREKQSSLCIMKNMVLSSICC